MTLLCHRWYDADLTSAAAAAVECGCRFRETRMSWSYTDPRRDETTVLLLTAPSALRSTEEEVGVEGAEGEGCVGGYILYALKVILFKGACIPAEARRKCGEDVTDMSTTREQHQQEEVYSAMFELRGPLDISVLNGTSGVVFLSSQQFFFHSVGGGKSLDRFVFLPAERKWERQCGAIKPLNEVVAIRNVLIDSKGRKQPQILLVSGVMPSSNSLLCTERQKEKSEEEGEDCMDLLIVASQDANVTKNPQTASLYTFVLAVLRCTIQTQREATPKWELLHFFADRAVPFHNEQGQQQQRTAVGMNMWNTAADNNNNNNNNNAKGKEVSVHPSQCTWCYIRSPDTRAREQKEKGNVGGIVIAIIPQETNAISVVCGGFDAEVNSYRIGFVRDQQTKREMTDRFSYSIENPEETLWSLSEDTHVVQMVLLGTPEIPLHPSSEEMHVKRTTSARRQNVTHVTKRYNYNINSAVRDFGLLNIVRFMVDFLDDGARGRDVDMDLNVKREKAQGLYFVPSVPWSRGKHGRLPVPRTVCWLNNVPLPIGKAVTSALLFSDINNSNNNHHSDNEGGINYNNLTTVDTTIINRDANSWYNALPTSIASSFSVLCGSGLVCCFMSVNTLLKKTCLTYVLEMNCENASVEEQEKKIQPSELLYMRPQCCRHIPNDDCGDDENNNNNDNKLAAYLSCYTAAATIQNRYVSKVAVVDGPNTSVIYDSLLQGTSPELIMYEAWRNVVMRRMTVNTISLLDHIDQSTEIHNSTHEICELGNSLRHFLLTFLIELDWMSQSDNDFIRRVVLLLLGAGERESAPLSSLRRESLSVRDGNSFVPLLAPNERQTMYCILKQSHMWDALAASLFAWVNQTSVGVHNNNNNNQEDNENYGGEILLEDVVRSWEEMITCKETGGSAFHDMLTNLRAREDAEKYRSGVVALLRSNVSLREVILMAVWKDEIVRSPLITFTQLLLETSVTCEDARKNSSIFSHEDINQLCLSLVRERLECYGTLYPFVELLYEWDFTFLESWPLHAMCGGLPVVYLILHLATVEKHEGKKEIHDSVSRAAHVLHWLSGDKMEQTMEVLKILCAGKIHFLALCFEEYKGKRHFINSEISMRSTTGSSSSSNTAVSGGNAYITRALHHIFVASKVSILTDVLAAPVIMHNATDDGTSSSNEEFLLLLWIAMMENDDAAAFNPLLLQQLHRAFLACNCLENWSSRPVSRAALLLKFLRPVFLTTLPCLFAAVVDQHETIEGSLAAAAVSVNSPGAAVPLAPPLDETESIEHVCRTTLHDVKQLLSLYIEESLEVRCLFLLFSAFETSSSRMLKNSYGEMETDRIRRTGRGEDGNDGDGGGDDMVFTFSPADMYFLALQILSNEPERFVISVEVMRRRLRHYLVHQMKIAILRQEEQKQEEEKEENSPCVLNRKKAVWWDSKAYLNNVADNLATVMSAFEKTAPLYAHAMLFLFLDESLSVMEESGKGNTVEPLSSEVQSEMLQCVRHVAQTHWLKLHSQEKKYLSRVLSNRLSLPGQESSESDAYQESEIHQQVVRGVMRMKEALKQKSINAELLRAVKGRNEEYSTLLTTEMKKKSVNNVVHDDKSSKAPFVSSTEITLFLKEEAYVRQHLHGQLMREYHMFTQSNAFLAAFGTLYLALREEQRRRVFVVFVREQYDIILTFACTFLLIVCETCRRETRVLLQNAMDRLQKQMRFLFLQERESRAAVEAVCLVERDILFHMSTEQCAVFEAESRMRFCIAEEEEVRRDAVYEVFAKEEMEVQEEEAWREEEAQWVAEMQREKNEHENDEGETKKTKKWQESPASDFLPRHDDKTTLQEKSESTSFPSLHVTGGEKRTVSPIDDVASSPASALAPLFDRSNRTAAAGIEGVGYHTLLNSSESLFGAFSRLQKQIISTVAPPPPAAAAISSKNNNKPSGEKAEDIPAAVAATVSVPPSKVSSAGEAPSHSTSTAEVWGDAFEDVMFPPPHLVVSHNHHDTVKRDDADTSCVSEKTHDDKSQRLRLKALGSTGKRRALRQRRLGDVVRLNESPTKEKENERDETEISIAREVSEVDENKQKNDQTLEMQTHSGIRKEDVTPSLEENVVTTEGVKKKEEEEENVVERGSVTFSSESLMSTQSYEEKNTCYYFAGRAINSGFFIPLFHS